MCRATVASEPCEPGGGVTHNSPVQGDNDNRKVTSNPSCSTPNDPRGLEGRRRLEVLVHAQALI